MTQPLSDRRLKAVIVGGSAGSFPVMAKVLSELPKDFKLPIIISMHRLKHVRNGFAEALSIKSKLPVHEVWDKEKIKPGIVYIAPANYHLLVELGGTLALSTEEMVHHSRPSINLLYESAAYAYEKKMIAIILSGANTDGAKGMEYARRKGCYTVVQDPKDCSVPTMVNAALDLIEPDEILDTDGIINLLTKL